MHSKNSQTNVNQELTINPSGVFHMAFTRCANRKKGIFAVKLRTDLELCFRVF